MSKPWESKESSEDTILVDADITCYASSASTDGRCYLVGEEEFKYKKEALSYCAEHEIDPESMELVYNPEPLSHALKLLKTALSKIQNRFNGAEMKLYLTGKTNFRNEVYTEYKKNRVGMRTPKHLKACKKYLLEKHGAILSEDCEADDMIAIEAHRMGEGYVVCTLDKDMDMIPGRHYNPRKDMEYTITPELGMQKFYRQLLTGDNTDNIPGLKGIGPVRAAKLITEDMEDEHAMYRVCLDKYMELDPIGNDEGEAEYYMRKIAEVSRNARLLWLQTEGGQVWQPPTGKD